MVSKSFFQRSICILRAPGLEESKKEWAAVKIHKDSQSQPGKFGQPSAVRGVSLRQSEPLWSGKWLWKHPHGKWGLQVIELPLSPNREPPSESWHQRTVVNLEWTRLALSLRKQGMGTRGVRSGTEFSWQVGWAPPCLGVPLPSPPAEAALGV